jgi:hypothetical protein
MILMNRVLEKRADEKYAPAPENLLFSVNACHHLHENRRYPIVSQRKIFPFLIVVLLAVAEAAVIPGAHGGGRFTGINHERAMTFCRGSQCIFHPLAVFSAASIACSQVFKRSGTVVHATEKQNVRCFSDDGLHIIAHAAVVEFHPLIAIIWPAVRVVVAFMCTAIE